MHWHRRDRASKGLHWHWVSHRHSRHPHNIAKLRRHRKHRLHRDRRKLAAPCRQLCGYSGQPLCLLRLLLCLNLLQSAAHTREASHDERRTLGSRSLLRWAGEPCEALSQAALPSSPSSSRTCRPPPKQWPKMIQAASAASSLHPA